MVYDVHVLFVGYSGNCEEGMVANCSCTLIRGRKNIIVDTMTPWDKDRIIAGLARYHLTPDDITLVVCTHGHSDHIGNNNLFLNAKHIVGYSVSYRDMYNLHPFEEGEPYIVDEDIKIVPTPGHTNSDVSVLVRTIDLGIVAVVGDLFEKVEDLEDPNLWRVTGGSENPKVQEKNRNKMLLLADHIIPGHGPIFAVTPLMRKEADHKLCSMAASALRAEAPERRPHDERDWRNPGENDDRSNPGHRPSVWEGRLGPSTEWDRPREHPDPRLDRPPARREELPERSWPDREREMWEDRRRLPNDHPFNPPPLLGDEMLKRIESKRMRNPPESWDGRQPRPDFDPGERNWPGRSGPEDRLPPTDRLLDERRPDGVWDERLGPEILRGDLIERSRERFGRNMDGRLPNHEERLRRDDRLARDDRLMRNERLPRDRLPPENKLGDIPSNRFGGNLGGGKLRIKRGSRGKGRKMKVGQEGPPDIKDGGIARPPRRDEGFRREDREPRRSGDDRLPRMKDDGLRREVRRRENDFHERGVRVKHNDEVGRNDGDPRTMRFHP